jgi:hypothetical protein
MQSIEHTVLAVALASLLAKCFADGILTRRLRGAAPPVTDLALIPLKDLVMVCVWALAWFKSTVEWRGNIFRVGAGSTLTALDHEAAPEAAGRPAH